MEEEDADSMSKSKEKWYPGKFMNKAIKRASSVSISSSETPSPSQSVSNPLQATSFHGVSTNLKRVSVIKSDPYQQLTENHAENDTSQDNNTLEHDVSPRILLGNLSLTIFDIKYLTVKNAKISIEVGDTSMVLPASEIQFPFTREFDILNICSDLKLEFRSNVAGSPPGVIILPLTSLLQNLGSPAAPKKCWREIYPSYERYLLGESRKMRKFRSAWQELPGSGLTKPQVSLGFVSMQAEIILPPGKKNALYMYFAPSPTSSRIQGSDRPSILRNSIVEQDAHELTLAVNQAIIQRDIQRIKSVLFRPFVLVEIFLSLPEVFILIALFGFLCYSIDGQQLPVAMVMVMFANGFVAKVMRTVQARVWNEPGVTLSSSTIPAVGSEDSPTPRQLTSPFHPTVQAVLRTNLLLQTQLAEFAHNVEVASNLFTFADMRVSLILYGTLFALATICSLSLTIFSVATVVSTVGATLLTLWASADFLRDQLLQLSQKSAYLSASAHIAKNVDLLFVSLSKVPDELELQHRSISAAQVVKEGGAEMLDAAANFAALQSS